MRCNRPEIRSHQIAAALQRWEGTARESAPLSFAPVREGDASLPQSSNPAETIHVKSIGLR